TGKPGRMCSHTPVWIAVLKSVSRGGECVRRAIHDESRVVHVHRGSATAAIGRQVDRRPGQSGLESYVLIPHPITRREVILPAGEPTRGSVPGDVDQRVFLE